jgi:hypothetical protein
MITATTHTHHLAKEDNPSSAGNQNLEGMKLSNFESIGHNTNSGSVACKQRERDLIAH